MKIERPNIQRTAKRLILAAAGSLLVLTVYPASGFAQRTGRGGTAQPGARSRPAELQMDEQTVIDVATAILHFTEAQKQQVQSIFDAAATAAIPIAVQIENSQNILFDAVKAGKTDDEIKMIAAKQGEYRAEILALQAETFAKMWALLNKDQKAEAGIIIYDGIGQFLSNAHPAAPASPPPLTVPTAPSLNAPPAQPAPAR